MPTFKSGYRQKNSFERTLGRFLNFVVIVSLLLLNIGLTTSPVMALGEDQDSTISTLPDPEVSYDSPVFTHPEPRVEDNWTDLSSDNQDIGISDHKSLDSLLFQTASCATSGDLLE